MHGTRGTVAALHITHRLPPAQNTSAQDVFMRYQSHGAPVWWHKWLQLGVWVESEKEEVCSAETSEEKYVYLGARKDTGKLYLLVKFNYITQTTKKNEFPLI